MRDWKDYDLEKTGRLTHPLRYEDATDRYVAVSWDDAFAVIGTTLKSIDRESAVFKASGFAGREASYLYAWLTRAYGNPNLSQSSNMCYKITSFGLTKVIGSPVGMIVWGDLGDRPVLRLRVGIPAPTVRGFCIR